MSEILFSRHPFPFLNDGNVLFVHFINNYAGDCTLIEIPEGDGTYKNFLIDMGYGKENQCLGGIDALRAFFDLIFPVKNQVIHYAIISHWHEDHYNDLAKLLKYVSLRIVKQENSNTALCVGIAFIDGIVVVVAFMLLFAVRG